MTMETLVDHYQTTCKGKKCGLCGNNHHDTAECPNRANKTHLDDRITLLSSTATSLENSKMKE